jgi:hypothetical protein
MSCRFAAWFALGCRFAAYDVQRHKVTPKIGVDYGPIIAAGFMPLSSPASAVEQSFVLRSCNKRSFIVVSAQHVGGLQQRTFVLLYRRNERSFGQGDHVIFSIVCNRHACDPPGLDPQAGASPGPPLTLVSA